MKKLPLALIIPFIGTSHEKIGAIAELLLFTSYDESGQACWQADKLGMKGYQTVMIMVQKWLL
jgi:hypothetical protein